VVLKNLKKGSDLVVAAAGVTEWFRITRHDRRSVPPWAAGGACDSGKQRYFSEPGKSIQFMAAPPTMDKMAGKAPCPPAPQNNVN
jgi:hypothetical protein